MSHWDFLPPPSVVSHPFRRYAENLLTVNETLGESSMRWVSRVFVLAGFLVMAGILPAAGGEGDDDMVFLDPAEAGPDFAVQGEYVGKIGTNTDVGAQVVALGDAKF